MKSSEEIRIEETKRREEKEEKRKDEEVIRRILNKTLYTVKAIDLSRLTRIEVM